MNGLFDCGLNTEHCHPREPMKVNMSKPPALAHKAAWICGKVGAPPISPVPR